MISNVGPLGNKKNIYKNDSSEYDNVKAEECKKQNDITIKWRHPNLR